MKREGLFYAKEKGNYFHCQSILDFCINNAVPHHCHPLELLPSSVILLLTSNCAGVWANLNLEFVAVSWSWQSQGSWLFKGSLSSKEQDLTERFGWNSIGVALSLSLSVSVSHPLPLCLPKNSGADNQNNSGEVWVKCLV